MSAPLSTIGGAVGVFAGTNIDDLVVLTALFLAARTQDRPRPGQIVGGQYLGFVALVAVSAGAAAGLVIVPDHWVGLLGLIPLALGIRGLWHARTHNGDDAPPLASGLLGVASVTIANGADNISIYTPLFRTLGVGATVLTVAVFLVLLAAWCAAGAWLGSHKKVVDALDRSGHLIVPVVFIAIGAWILLESGVLTRLF
ncbi:cadmium resistance transporter [Actinocrispum sp. NPDC049592]|uniref:cadmium resistance transporter n=1 Tax=Actinocrispum sp. NPDC049592 TaxID=3154835 RepID=UPI003439E559